VKLVEKSAGELVAKSDEDSSSIQQQLIDLAAQWERVQHLAQIRSRRLTDAKSKADDFHGQCRRLMEYFAGVESRLRQFGALTEEDNESSLERVLKEHSQFHEEFQERSKPLLDECLSLGHSILSDAHLDAEKPIRHWISILNTRAQEVRLT
jgi:uncharacterized coiled-coil DUF342 family protein